MDDDTLGVVMAFPYRLLEENHAEEHARSEVRVGAKT